MKKQQAFEENAADKSAWSSRTEGPEVQEEEALRRNSISSRTEQNQREYIHTYIHTGISVSSGCTLEEVDLAVSLRGPVAYGSILHVQYFLITLGRGPEVGPRRVSAPWLSVGTEGAHRRGDFAPTSGSPVAPSRTCRLFPRRDSRSPHLSSVRVSRYPSTPLGRLSFSLLQLLLPPTFLSLSSSYSLLISLSFFSTLILLYSSPFFCFFLFLQCTTLSRQRRHTCAPRAPSTRARLFIFRYFRTAARYTTLYASHEFRTRCRFPLPFAQATIIFRRYVIMGFVCEGMRIWRTNPTAFFRPSSGQFRSL